MITATRRIQFCCGHRVHMHESKCRNLHGHNYVAHLSAHSPELDELGRVIDFSVLKEKLGGWIDENWDHGFVLSCDDHGAQRAVRSIGSAQKLYLMPNNPTAENMALHLLRVSQWLLDGTGVELASVRLWETENCYADAQKGDLDGGE